MVYNPSYLGDRALEYYSLGPAARVEGGRVSESPVWTNKQGVCLALVIPAIKKYRQLPCKPMRAKDICKIRARGVSQVVEQLPSKCEAPSANPSATKNVILKEVYVGVEYVI